MKGTEKKSSGPLERKSHKKASAPGTEGSKKTENVKGKGIAKSPSNLKGKGIAKSPSNLKGPSKKTSELTLGERALLETEAKDKAKGVAKSSGTLLETEANDKGKGVAKKKTFHKKHHPYARHQNLSSDEEFESHINSLRYQKDHGRPYTPEEEALMLHGVEDAIDKKNK